MKTALGVIIGFAIAIVIIYLGHYITNYSILPAGDTLTGAEWEDYLEQLPASAYIIVLFINTLATALGAFIAQSIARTPGLTPAAAVGFFVLVGIIILTLIIRSHPLWFVIVNLLVIIPAALLAGRYSKRVVYGQNKPL